MIGAIFPGSLWAISWASLTGQPAPQLQPSIFPLTEPYFYTLDKADEFF